MIRKIRIQDESFGNYVILIKYDASYSKRYGLAERSLIDLLAILPRLIIVLSQFPVRSSFTTFDQISVFATWDPIDTETTPWVIFTPVNTDDVACTKLIFLFMSVIQWNQCITSRMYKIYKTT